MFDTLDGTFPNHEANPLKLDTLEPLQAQVRDGKFDFGIAYDGDADRVGFVDEKGNVIPMDMITALIAKTILTKEKGPIFYDLRSSWAVKEVILENGGKPMMCRVGHAFIKQQMRDAKAHLRRRTVRPLLLPRELLHGELRPWPRCTSRIWSASPSKPLSELIKPIQRYFGSGEINSEVHDVEAVFKRLREKYRKRHDDRTGRPEHRIRRLVVQCPAVEYGTARSPESRSKDAAAHGAEAGRTAGFDPGNGTVSRTNARWLAGSA